jgi:hypothetical protein
MTCYLHRKPNGEYYWSQSPLMWFVTVHLQ